MSKAKKFVPRFHQAQIINELLAHPSIKRVMKERGLKVDKGEMERMMIDALDAEAARMGLKLVKRKGAKR